jgi:hypothetical protein
MIDLLVKTLKSARLTLVLLLLLSFLALLGTVPRPVESVERSASSFARLLGFRNTFRSPLFVGATALLAVNVLFCTAQRFKGSHTRRLRSLPDLVMHLALVLVICGGGVKAIWGTVRTVTVPVGTETGSVYDWKSEADVPLGFVLRVVRLDFDYHPVRALLGVRDSRTGAKIGVVEIGEGKKVPLPRTGWTAGLLSIDRQSGLAQFAVQTPTAAGEISLSLAPGPGASAEFEGAGFTLVAFKDEVKMVRALVNATVESGLVIERWLSPNGGVDVEGSQLALTSWGNDQFGNPFAGFQVSRDPGAPLFWAGCVLLACALPLHAVGRSRRRTRTAVTVPVRAGDAGSGATISRDYRGTARRRDPA